MSEHDEDDLPFADALEGGERGKQAEALRAFMLVCLPPKTFGQRRRFRSGYIRMVAFAWRLAPELLSPCKTDEQVAELIGLSRIGFEKHLKKVDLLLRRPAQKKPDLSQDWDNRGSSRAGGSPRGSE